jgi:hypothetical protein
MSFKDISLFFYPICRLIWLVKVPEIRVSGNQAKGMPFLPEEALFLSAPRAK